jgi:beta-lactamase regulating signal transducer with metallopeptidase domain
MNILQMSVAAGVMIITIIFVRFIAADKLPKKVFLAFWFLVLFRLTLPFSIPVYYDSPVGLPFEETLPTMIIPNVNRTPTSNSNQPTTSIDNQTTTPNGNQTTTPIDNRTLPDYREPGVLANNFPPGISAPELKPENNPVIKTATSGQNFWQASYWVVVWVAGMVGMVVFFVVVSIKQRIKFKGSFPVENRFVQTWMQNQHMFRKVKVRYSDRVLSPITYGLFRPVILFPKNTDWQNETQLKYILTHEMTHIKRNDILTKWLFAAVLCVHWFNPLVWVMYILLNRDIEYACDEAVVSFFGQSAKTVYANILIGMEEKRSGLLLSYNSFANKTITERIKKIMKTKKTSRLSIVLSLVLVLVLSFGSFLVFAANANDPENDADNAYVSADYGEPVDNQEVGDDEVGMGVDIPVYVYLKTDTALGHNNRHVVFDEHTQTLWFIDPVTGDVWVAAGQRRCESFSYGLDILYERINENGETVRMWKCHGSFMMDEYVFNGSHDDTRREPVVVGNSRFDYHVNFEITYQDGAFVIESQIYGCIRPNCSGSGVVQTTIVSGMQRTGNQRFCIHHVFGVDLEYRLVLYIYAICHNCNSIIIDQFENVYSWRCYGFN